MLILYPLRAASDFVVSQRKCLNAVPATVLHSGSPRRRCSPMPPEPQEQPATVPVGHPPVGSASASAAMRFVSLIACLPRGLIKHFRTDKGTQKQDSIYIQPPYSRRSIQIRPENLFPSFSISTSKILANTPAQIPLITGNSQFGILHPHVM